MGRRKAEEDPLCWDIDRFTKFKMTPDQAAKTTKAITEVLSLQAELGIDVVSDGEMKRENYAYYFCRHLKGMDFEHGADMVLVDKLATMKTPVVRSRLEPNDAEPWCAKDWAESQKLTHLPLKYTLPGPLVTAALVTNEFYTDPKEMLYDLRDCVNREVRALAAAGCKHIQIDDASLACDTKTAIEYGIDIIADCFKGVSGDVQKIVHLCCGYPSSLDEDKYRLADRLCYLQLADKLDNAGFDAVSIEDAHCNNDLQFLEKYKKSTIIMGSVAIAKSAIESQATIEGRLREALKYLPPERLMVAPDCGLGYLPSDILRKKLMNMVAAAKAVC